MSLANQKGDKMKLIYIAVPYASDPKRGIELSIKYGQIIAKQGDTPISPVLLFDPIFTCDDLCEATHREFILDSCIRLLDKCDEAWFITVNSKMSAGQIQELKHCLMNGHWEGIKWKFIKSEEEE